MGRLVTDLSAEELETLVGQAVDQRLQVWLGQLMDALMGMDDEDSAELNPSFADSLRRSLEQANAGDTLDLESFRARLGR